MGEMRRAYRSLIGRPERKRLDLVLDRVQSWDFVNTVLNLGVLRKEVLD
jgi:hypothetical protein